MSDANVCMYVLYSTLYPSKYTVPLVVLTALAAARGGDSENTAREIKQKRRDAIVLRCELAGGAGRYAN